MRFDCFTEQDYLDSGFLLVRDLDDVSSLACRDVSSLACRRTRDFRIDEYIPIEKIDGKSLILIDPDRERRIKKHTKRIQRELRRRKSSIA
jgi:hypothetical protein